LLVVDAVADVEDENEIEPVAAVMGKPIILLVNN
jgi:hypothetical protein